MKKMFENFKNYSKENNAFDFFRENKLIICFSILLILGMILGSLSVKNVGVDTIKNLDFLFANDFEQRISEPYFATFIASFSSIAVFILCIIFFTLSASGIACIPLTILFRGFGIGISAGYLYLIHGLKGVAFHILILLPGIFVSSIGLILISAESVKFSYKYLKKLLPKSSEEKLWDKLKVYFKKITYLMTLLALSAGIDTLFMFLFSRFFKF